MGEYDLMVLDTCAVIWLAFNRDKFSKNTLNKIDTSNNVMICTMSFWEIGIKIKKKKLLIPLGLEELIHLYVNNENVMIVTPDLDIITNSLKLKWKHKDPIDRFIVAIAKKYNDYIISSDTTIKKYYKKTIL